MNIHFGKHLIFYLSLVCILSCRTQKNFSYFKDIPDSSGSAIPAIPLAQFKEPVIKPNDILQISILTLDADENTILNSVNTPVLSNQIGGAGVATQGVLQGFQVDAKGSIEIPVIGKIDIAGLTTAQARDSIHNRVAVFYKDPVVNVKFANFSITVLGEVARPGAYTIPNEKVSILDVLGMAGDLTIYGKRENVLLIRDSAGHKIFSRFNLGTAQILKSPYYYLQQGDMVYVEPNKAKIASSDATKTRNYALLASVITVLVVIISRI